MARGNGRSKAVQNGAGEGSGEADAVPAATGPLAGIVLLDFTRFQQGTHGTLLLSDLGADIIKIEPPGGDPGRRLGVHIDGHSSYFEALNRNKRSLCLDLRKHEAREVVTRIAKRADIVAENFRPGTMERMGLGYDVLSKENPGLIYASASMFGGRGPRSHDPGYDTIAQAAGGMMMFNKSFHRAWHDETPFPAQPGIADQTGGVMLAHGILAALVHKLRTGRGQKVDVSLYGSQISIQSIHVTRALHPVPLKPPGQSSQVLSHRAICGDGNWIAFGFLEASKWPNLARGVGLAELIDDPRFHSAEARSTHHGELVERIDAMVATRPAAEWIASLRENDCPCTIVQDYEMVAHDEQALANGYIVTYDHPTLGTTTAPGPAAILEETPAAARFRAPLYPGEHTRAILHETGFSEAEIAALLDSGAAHAGELPAQKHPEAAAR